MHPIRVIGLIATLGIATPLAAQSPIFMWQRIPLPALDTARPPAATKPVGYRSDALLPNHRIVAFYGNTLSKRMGILGELPPEQMMAKLDSVAAEWQLADSSRVVVPALHLIVTVAQREAGRDGAFRLRHGNSLISPVAEWAEARGWLLFLDVQPGRAPIRAEVERLDEWLRKPFVHLGIDPEFAMPEGQVPGKRIGTLDAIEVNQVSDYLARLVTEERIPPKVLVVHRFTEGMLTNSGRIAHDPRVQVVIDADGFGSPANKRSIYAHVVGRRPVQFAGLKLFYKNDKPIMTPAEVVSMRPTPVYIQYQ